MLTKSTTSKDHERCDNFAQYMVNAPDDISSSIAVRGFNSQVRRGMCDCLGREKINISVETLGAFYTKQYCNGCGKITDRKKSGAESLADFLRRVLTPEDFQMLVNDFLSVSTRENEGMFAFMRLEDEGHVEAKYRAKLDAISDYMSELDEGREL